VSLDRTERTGLPGHDTGIKRAVDKSVWAEQLGEDSWNRAQGQDIQDGTAGTARQDSWYRTAWTGQPGQNSWDRTARTGKQGQENWDMKFRKTDRIVQPG
jgi:hypothetical protein